MTVIETVTETNEAAKTADVTATDTTTTSKTDNRRYT